MSSPRRLIVSVSLAALLAAGAGYGAAQLIDSPAEAAAKLNPPAAGPITVPVQKSELNSTVVTRGDVGFNDSTAVTVPPGSNGAGVVTGKVPKTGKTVDEGDVILEVSGRPVIALAGSHPSYRTLMPGSKGADVKQLQKALQRLGYETGKADGKYDGQVADAVAALYRDLGYDAPKAAEDRTGAADSAKSELTQAKEQLKQAKKALAEALRGPKKSERLSAEGQVSQAKAELRQAQKARPRDPVQVVSAKNRLAVAQAQLAELMAGSQATAERKAVKQAEAAVEKAEKKRDKAREAAKAPLPQSEVVVLPELPRRIEEVDTKLGATVEGAVMTVAGTDLQVTASVTEAEAKLLKKGMTATLEMPDGTENKAKITKLKAGEDDVTVTLEPGSVTAAQATDLRGANVKVTISVGSSDGEVLSVPSAALFSTADGTVKVEVLKDDGMTRMQSVTTGLTADGQTEVHPSDEEQSPVEEGSDTLTEGTLVVVGR